MVRTDGKQLAGKSIVAVVLAAFLITGPPLITSTIAQAQTKKRPTVQRNRSYTDTSIIRVGTNLRVRLNDTISSDRARVGDRFTATVISPSRYEEATITGHVGSITKSGKIKGRTTMNLAFDRIKLPDGRSGTMRGQVIRVYESNSESASKVDEEGTVESGKRGEQTLKRGGIGAAAGAVFGGLLGGRKGAAIGLIVGGAAGAGSLAIGGSKKLELESGTEMLVRVSSR
jgi:hypothetical protein